MDVIGNFLNDIFLAGTEWCMSVFIGVFNGSLGILQTDAALTPVSFNASVVAILRGISNTIIMPLAGLLLTYVFCYELITMITEKNNMAEFDVQGLFWLIMKTAISITLMTNCFNITLAFFDLGAELVTSAASPATPSLSLSGIVAALRTDVGSNVGMGLVVLLFSLLSFLAGIVACGLIYLVSWSRIVIILIYVSVAPIPFSTFMSNNWLGEIGKNYIKNLMALALQGFLMVVCMIIYGGLVTNVQDVIASQGAIMGIVTLLVCMFVCVKSLMSCLSVSKSIFGAQ